MTQNQPATQLPTIRIIWFALLAAQFSFIFIAYTTPPPAESADLEMIRLVLGFTAMGSFALSFVIPKIFLQNSMRAVRAQGLSPDSMDLAPVLPKILPALIVRYALLESVTLNGFLLSFLSGDDRYVVAFAAIALVGFAISYPSERYVRNQISA